MERLSSVREILGAPEEARRIFLDALIPEALVSRYALAWPCRWEEGAPAPCRWKRSPGGAGIEIEVWARSEAEDPSLALELADSYYGQLEIVRIVVNDVDRPRFHVDRDERGHAIPAGAPERNLGEELRAMRAGLAPFQIRPGLRLLGSVLQRVEGLAAALGAGIVYVAPLAYHNAVQYERSGFAYASDLDEMLWIHREFRAGGRLRARMDGSTAFRMPWMADTIRGRSWGIHDGVMERRWIAPQMYKLVGRSSPILTAPGTTW